MRLLIVNPNTSHATNARIRAVAAPRVRECDDLEVLSAPSGIELIESVAQSVATIPAVLSVVDERHAQVDAIIIAAFSDPGLSEARRAASCPVFGISESAMKTAARLAERFAIVTLNAELREAVEANAVACGHGGQLTGVRILPWSLATVSANPPAFRQAFVKVCAQAVAEDGAGAVIIGGGPLSGIAETIAEELPVPVLDGVRCAVEMALASRSRGCDSPGAAGRDPPAVTGDA